MDPQRKFLQKFIIASLAMAVAIAIMISHDKAFASALGFAEDTFQSYFEMSYFNSTQNYDSNGNPVSLVGNNYFQEIRGKVDMAYDVSNTFGIYGSSVFKSNTAQTATFNRQNSNFTDILVGADLMLYSGFVDVIPDFSVDVPLYPSPGSDTGVAMGDGAVVTTGKIHLTKHFKPLAISAYAGYAYRTGGLSGILPWGAAIYAATKSLFGQLGASGTATISNDSYTNAPVLRTQITNTYDGGSLAYYAVNPSWIDANLRAGWYFSKHFYVMGGADIRVAGTNTAQELRFLGGIGFSDLGETKIGRRQRTEADPDKFEDDTDSEDKTLPQEPGT